MIFAPWVYPVPHWKVEPAAAVPPLAVKIVLDPLHIVVEVAVNVLGDVEGGDTVTVCVIPAVGVLHGAASTRRTQYVVVVVGFTYNEALAFVAIIFVPATVPVPHSKVDPVAPIPPDAVNVVPVPWQIEVAPEIVVGAVEPAQVV
jgi:hypothetical protein